MRAIPRLDRHTAPLIAGFLAMSSLLLGAPAFAGTIIRLSWSENTDADLAGYRLYYGTEPGTYGPPIDLDKVTSYELDTLVAARRYYFVLTALDEAGNESLPSAEVFGAPAAVHLTLPTVDSALEVLTNSIYLARGGTSLVRVTGTNFQPGALMFVPVGVAGRPTTFVGPTELTASIPILATASLGVCGVTIINPDSGAGRIDSALEVVKNPDLNQDCSVDIVDLNGLARAWHSSNADAAFNADADLNGDDYIDGDDLAILVKFFARPPGSCP